MYSASYFCVLCAAQIALHANCPAGYNSSATVWHQVQIAPWHRQMFHTKPAQALNYTNIDFGQNEEVEQCGAVRGYF